MSNLILLIVAIFVTCTNSNELHRLCTYAPADVDCSSLLGLPNGTCLVKHMKTNSSECQQLILEPNHKRNVQLGHVEIRPFVWDYNNEHFYKHTLFNITFSNITWRNLKFRLQAVENNNTKGYKNHCRELQLFNVSNSIVIPALSYDCYWSQQDRRYENEAFIFEYKAELEDKVDHGRYVFIIPPVKSLQPNAIIKKIAPFIYIHFDDPPQVSLNILPLSEDLSEIKYIVKACFSKDLNSNVKCENVETITLVMYNKTVYSYKPKLSGWYYFQLLPKWAECKDNCPSFYSTKFHIDSDNIVYTVLWNVLYVCVGFIVLGAVVWMIKRWRRRFKPTVLLMYSHHDKNHQYVIKLLKEYMETDLRWNVMWEDEIDDTRHNDPHEWCLEKCTEAHCILYFLKPSNCNTVHGKPTEIATISAVLNRMDELLFTVLRNLPAKKKGHVFNVVFDACGEFDLPSEMCQVRTYYITGDWDWLVHKVLRNNRFDQFIRPNLKLKDTIRGREILRCFNTLQSSYDGSTALIEH